MHNPDESEARSALRLRDILAWITLTILADICLYTHPGGTGAAVLVLATTVALLALARRRTGSTALLLTLALSAAMLAWNASGGPALAVIVAAPALALRLLHPKWRVTEILCAAPAAVLRAPLSLIEHLSAIVMRRTPSGVQPTQSKAGRRIQIILIPLVVTSLFLVIFTAANPVLERIATNLGDFLSTLFEPLFSGLTLRRPFTWIGWLLIFAALLRPFAASALAERLSRKTEQLTPPQDSASSPDSFPTAIATLVCVNLLFLAFNAFDSVYLYFKADLPEGISWAEYAHEGCFWLTLALILSTVVIGITFRSGLTFHVQSRALRMGSYVWAAQNLVLAAGALRRLQMYVDYNGLTRLRIVGVYGILLVLIGLGVMVWKVARGRNFLWIVRRDLQALCLALALLALTPRDLICWHYNVAQVMNGNPRPLALLTNQDLSPEAYPAMLPLLDHPKLWVREGMAAFLGLRADELKGKTVERWTQWQGSHAWARRYLEGAREKIEDLCPRSGWSTTEDRFLDRVRPWLHSRVLTSEVF